MADARRTTTKKTDEPTELNTSDANVLDPQPPVGQHDPQAEENAREAKHADLDDLRNRRNEAAAAGDAAATAHLDNLIRETEALEAEKDDASK